MRFGDPAYITCGGSDGGPYPRAGADAHPDSDAQPYDCAQPDSDSEPDRNSDCPSDSNPNSIPNSNRRSHPPGSPTLIGTWDRRPRADRNPVCPIDGRG